MDLNRSADAVLFDKDGTLFDFGASWGAWAEAVLTRLAAGDANRARNIAASVGYDMQTKTFSPDSHVIAGTVEDVARCIAPHVDLTWDALIADINEDAMSAPMVPAVPLIPLMDELRAAGLVLGIATNDARAPTLAHLTRAGIASHFSYVAASDIGLPGKPNPAMCIGFARHTGLAPDRIVMVGDSLHDLHAGRAAGMQVVAVTTGMASAEVLAPHADAVLADIGNLPKWLGLSGTD